MVVELPLSMLLSISGNETTMAHTGPEAVERAEDFKPDVILLDIGLPEMDGYEVCRTIRRRPWAHDIKIIAVTGWGQAEDRQRSAEAGFDDHLVKPVDPDTIVSVLPRNATRVNKA